MGIAQLDIVNMIGNAGHMVQFVMLLLLFFSIMSWAITTSTDKRSWKRLGSG